MRPILLWLGAACLWLNAAAVFGQASGNQSASSNTPRTEFPNVLYGAAYYNE
jgi:hypothetical protein